MTSDDRSSTCVRRIRAHQRRSDLCASPSRSLEDWVRDVEEVLDLGVSHVSLYELTFEAGTPFGRGRGSRLDGPQRTTGLARRRCSRSRANGSPPVASSGTRSRTSPFRVTNPSTTAFTGGTSPTSGSDQARSAASGESGPRMRGRLRMEPSRRFDRIGRRGTRLADTPGHVRRNARVRTPDARRSRPLGAAPPHRARLRRPHGAGSPSSPPGGLAELDGDRLRLTLAGVVVLDSILLDFVRSRAASRKQVLLLRQLRFLHLESGAPPRELWLPCRGRAQRRDPGRGDPPRAVHASRRLAGTRDSERAGISCDLILRRSRPGADSRSVSRSPGARGESRGEARAASIRRSTARRRRSCTRGRPLRRTSREALRVARYHSLVIDESRFLRLSSSMRGRDADRGPRHGDPASTAIRRSASSSIPSRS